MRSTTKDAEIERLEFAQKAAAFFKANPEGTTFGDILPGHFLALRWGMGGDCVLVVKLAEYDEPINYQQLVRT